MFISATVLYKGTKRWKKFFIFCYLKYDIDILCAPLYENLYWHTNEIYFIMCEYISKETLFSSDQIMIPAHCTVGRAKI